MRTATSTLELRSPRALDEALRMLRDEQLVPIAGTTDVFVTLNFGTLTAKRFIDIWKLDELREIAVRDDVLTIGALASYTSIIRSPDVRSRLPMLVEAAGQIGGKTIDGEGPPGGQRRSSPPGWPGASSSSACFWRAARSAAGRPLK